MKNFQPVIIIGAARSGTNMLRNILTRTPLCSTWDCDEINPIWRHGNLKSPNDEFDRQHATSKIKNFINREFEKTAYSLNTKYLIEKTAANSLRLSFVHEIFPDAKYIVIFRDGRDSIVSAMKRWVVPIDWPYTLRKLRHTPKIDLPYYLYSFVIRRSLNRGKDNRMPTWGPVYKGMAQDARELSLLEVCAKQWNSCVQNTMSQMNEIDDENKIIVKYENFVNNPMEECSSLLKFIGLNPEEMDVAHMTSEVTSSKIGSFRKLPNAEISVIENICGVTLNELNYK